MRRLATTGLAFALAGGAAVAVAAPASASVPKKTVNYTTYKSGVKDVQGWGWYRAGKYKGRKTVVINYKIKDTRRNGRLAALQVRFTDSRYSDETWYVWNRKDRVGTAQRTDQSYRIGHLYSRECNGNTYAKGTKFRAKKCGGWRKFY